MHHHHHLLLLLATTAIIITNQSIIRAHSWRITKARLTAVNGTLLVAKKDVRVATALDIIIKTIQAHGLNNFVVAFNGGKDCLVVVYLVLAACHLMGHLSTPPKLVYFIKDDEFPEMIAFMRDTVRLLGLDLEDLHGGYKVGLSLLQSRGVKAIALGQRRSDPYCPSHAFAKTTEGWPEMIRVNPIIDFDYDLVWRFIRDGGFKYCQLYDRGYTSLGAMSETVPHPHLVEYNKSAFELLDGDEVERIGRIDSGRGLSNGGGGGGGDYT